MSVISEATGTITATIGVGSGPAGIAVDPRTGTVYVTNYDSDTVSVISEATGTVIATVDLGGGLYGGPFGIAVDPSAGAAFVANEDSGTVSVITPEYGTIDQLPAPGSR